jgi:hypothetical protein
VVVAWRAPSDQDGRVDDGHHPGAERPPPVARERRRAAAVRVAGAAAVAAYAWWAVGLPAFSAAATAAVVGAGAVAEVAGAHARARRPGGPPPATGTVRVAPWFALAGVLAAVQLVAYLHHPRDEHPTLSSLTNAVLDSQAARAAAFVAWLAAAVALARR